MVLNTILILIVLQFANIIPEKVQQDFKVSKDQVLDLAASETCLISIVNKSSKMTCMGTCNSNIECRQ
jgi:hypothetical protein